MQSAFSCSCFRGAPDIVREMMMRPPRVAPCPSLGRRRPDSHPNQTSCDGGEIRNNVLSSIVIGMAPPAPAPLDSCSGACRPEGGARHTLRHGPDAAPQGADRGRKIGHENISSTAHAVGLASFDAYTSARWCAASPERASAQAQLAVKSGSVFSGFQRPGRKSASAEAPHEQGQRDESIVCPGLPHVHTEMGSLYSLFEATTHGVFGLFSGSGYSTHLNIRPFLDACTGR